MITILSILETGYQTDFEHRALKQLTGAYQCKLIAVGHDYHTYQEGIDAAVGTKVWMTPPGRVPHSTEFSEWTPPEGDLVFCFGSPQDDITAYIAESDICLQITTAHLADMMACTVAAIVLYVHG